MHYITKLSFLRTEGPSFLRLLALLVSDGFSKTPRMHGFPFSRGSVARLLEIQAETAMNHILIDSTGAPRPRALPLHPRACVESVWHHKESRLVVHRGEGGKPRLLKMKNRHCRNLFNGRPRLALSQPRLRRARALLIIRSARNRKSPHEGKRKRRA